MIWHNDGHQGRPKYGHRIRAVPVELRPRDEKTGKLHFDPFEAFAKCAAEFEFGNVRSDGITLYSYSEPIARKFDDLAWVTARRWSHTTAGHVSNVLRALKNGGDVCVSYCVPGEPTDARAWLSLEYDADIRRAGLERVGYSDVRTGAGLDGNRDPPWASLRKLGLVEDHQTRYHPGDAANPTPRVEPAPWLTPSGVKALAFARNVAEASPELTILDALKLQRKATK